MTIDVPLLRKVLEHITVNPEEWDQEHWAHRTSCGTSHCLAGHVVVMTGHEIYWDPRQYREGAYQACYTTRDETISDVAAKELGLNEFQLTLFAGHNSLRDLWNYAHEWTDGEIAIPAQLPESRKEPWNA